MVNLGDTLVSRLKSFEGGTNMAKYRFRITLGRSAAFSNISHLPKREILCLTRAASLQNRLKQKITQFSKSQRVKD